MLSHFKEETKTLEGNDELLAEDIKAIAKRVEALEKAFDDQRVRDKGLEREVASARPRGSRPGA
jgi:hypothetical protein